MNLGPLNLSSCSCTSNKNGIFRTCFISLDLRWARTNILFDISDCFNVKILFLNSYNCNAKLYLTISTQFNRLSYIAKYQSVLTTKYASPICAARATMEGSSLCCFFGSFLEIITAINIQFNVDRRIPRWTKDHWQKTFISSLQILFIQCAAMFSFVEFQRYLK